mgnify:CR=1 FL=1
MSYNVTKLPATDAYKLELTNELAGINCDKDGNIYPNAVRPTCQAIIYHGEKEEDEGVQYGISYPSSNNVQGVSIDTTTGILTFGSNFSFVGSSLEITVTAKVKNTGNTYSGKEVVQVYISSPFGRFCKEYQSLAGFVKTKIIVNIKSVLQN